jgi:GNAT superfamily N-acetyltransferase
VVGAHAGNGPWDNDLHHIGDVYLNSRGEFLVGIYEGRIVAMGALKRTSNNRAEIKRMRVHPDFQRRGFGQVILQRLESRAVELGYTTLYLETTIQQTAAQQLYLKNGYTEIGQTKWDGYDVIRYEKNL